MRLTYGGQRHQAVKGRIFSKLLVLAEVAVIALVSCKNKQAHDYTGVMPAASERSQLAVDKIVTCRNFDELKKGLTEFANYLVGEKNGVALNDMYETIYQNMLALMKRSKDDNEPYVDDLTMLAEEFEKRKTDNEKMAIVFLALPRLFERELIIAIKEPLGLTIEEVRLTAEEDFLRMVWNYKPELEKLIRKYWYKKDMMLPTAPDREMFFQELVKLY